MRFPALALINEGGDCRKFSHQQLRQSAPYSRDLVFQSTSDMMCIMNSRMALFSVAMALSCSANANLITNGSFEDGNFVPNGDQTMVLGAGAMDIAGWTVIDDSIAWINNGNPFNGYMASDGSKCLDLTGYEPGSPYGGVTQSFATTIGTQYEVSLDLGAHPSYTNLVCLTVEAAGQSTILTTVPGTTQTWIHHTWRFMATGTTTTLNLKGFLSATSDIGLDNVMVEAVPEPATLAVLGLGLVAALRRRRA